MHIYLVVFLFCGILTFQIGLSDAKPGTPDKPAKPCKTTADCKCRKECCVQEDMRRGKRSMVSGEKRTCQKLGKVGDKCYMSPTPMYEEPHVYFTPGCPCRKGHYCQLDGKEVPQGDVGKCVKGKRPEKNEA